MTRQSLYKLLPAIVLSILCFTQNACKLTKKHTVYDNNFNSKDLSGLEIHNINGIVNGSERIFFFNGSNVLGRFNNNSVVLNLPSLPSHDYIKIEFDLYTHDQWEGDTTSANGKPDIWTMLVDGNQVLTTTFSNMPGRRQSYPGFYGSPTTVSSPPRGDAADTLLQGVCSLKEKVNGTTRYSIVQFIPHSGGALKLQLGDALQPFNEICLKSWSIDNLKITTLQN